MGAANKKSFVIDREKDTCFYYLWESEALRNASVFSTVPAYRRPYFFKIFGKKRA